MATSRRLETPTETQDELHSSESSQSDHFPNKLLTSLAAIITLTRIERQNHPAFPTATHSPDAPTNSAIPRAT